MKIRRSVAWLLPLLAAAWAVPGFASGVSPEPATGPVIEEALLARIAGSEGGSLDALVSLGGTAGPADVAAVQGLGLSVLRVFEDFGILYVAGAGENLLRLAGLPRVTAVVDNAPITMYQDTATVATRARDAWDAKSTSTPLVVGGSPVDGSGVGVAIVDTGVDAGHPDLAPAVAQNRKFICSTPFLINPGTGLCFGNWLAGTVLQGAPITGCSSTPWVDLINSDTTSGHGTHVAGIVAGRGVVSDGRFMGAAPGATLYGLGVGDSAAIFAAVEAFQWVNCNYNLVSPPIRVVTNSWGSGGAFSATNPINVAANTLVGNGITVLFAAGNDGGTGATDRVSSYAKNPTPGVLGVASYNDDDRATRSGSLSDFSSRGKSTDTNKNNWPDISAPGDGITSTWGGPSTYAGPPFALTYYPYYTALSGTSMATPHVAGIVALLKEASPLLTPAAIEDILEDTAVQFVTPGGYVTDLGNTTTGINYGAGHGLVDAIAALGAAGAAGGSSLPQISQSPHIYFLGADGQVVSAIQWTEIQGQSVVLSERFLTSGNTVAYPLASGQAANFRVSGPGGIVNLNTTLTTEATDITNLRMNATHVFPSPGSYTIESQINFGSGLVSFDSFMVTICSTGAAC